MLAIVIPYFKHDFFDETLKSLALQTDKRFHVYIGDDASHVHPRELLKKYKGRFSFTYSRFQSNLGKVSLVKQWERCLEMVKDEIWVQILGDDDVLSANAVSMFYESLDTVDQVNSNVIRFATQVINEKGELISRVYKHPILEKPEDFLIRKYKGGTRSSLSEFIFRKEKVDTIKFKDFPLAWASDILGIVEFSGVTAIYTINNALVLFRISDKNITGQADSVEKNEAWFMFYLYVLSNYGKAYPDELITMLFDRIEKVQLNNKKTPLRWMSLFRLYLRFNKCLRFLYLLVKVKKSIR